MERGISARRPVSRGFWKCVEPFPSNDRHSTPKASGNGTTWQTMFDQAMPHLHPSLVHVHDSIPQQKKRHFHSYIIVQFPIFSDLASFVSRWARHCEMARDLQVNSSFKEHWIASITQRVCPSFSCVGTSTLVSFSISRSQSLLYFPILEWF
jgi:hypothetical protein